ncbi:Cna B-type domain-containing protein [Miniphocaeibacter halophilus]|uniref:Cna B-type domain-containing protein n=1 Tax=Miniphocaeibacter halophilus TaxID=2931922 RepID=A0AC61MSX5_9FIRM|nr:Cna B-type domain-containing protein [Miniphocaeibacter halophilus]QQK08770.1 Cna B-type domain-containing protein [Miniphocaeibacter halophilus]
MKKFKKGLSFLVLSFMLLNIILPIQTLASTTGEVNVKVNWSDNENKNGKRPESVEVELFANEKSVGTATLNERGKWSYKWAGLAKEEKGKAINYTVKEKTFPSEYIISKNTKGGLITITATYKVEENKVVETSSTKAPKVEEKITLAKAETPKATEAPKVEEDKQTTVATEETKQAKETKAPEVTTVVETKEEKISVKVRNVWEDNNNSKNLRPASIKVQLNKGGTAVNEPVELNEGNNWTYTWSDLDKADDYTVTVVEPAKDYDFVYNKEKETITATLKEEPTAPAETTSITAEKVWKDNGNKTKARPSYVEVQLYKDNKATGEAVKLDANNKWTHTWDNLPKTENDKNIEYTVKEVNVPKGYEVSYDAKSKVGRVYVINTIKPVEVETTSITAEKVWKDNDNKTKARPSYVEVQLYKDNKATGEAVKLDANNKWTYTWDNLPKTENGKNIEYTVKEVNVPKGYEVSYDTKSKVGRVYVINTIKTTPTDNNKTSVTVEKKWDDKNSKSRPTSVEVRLYKNGKAIGQTVKLDEKNKWKYTWTNLDKTENSKTVKYTVKEVNVPRGYEAKYSTDRKTGNLIVTNTLKTTSVGRSTTRRQLPKTGIASTLGTSIAGLGLVLGGISQFKKKDD